MALPYVMLVCPTTGLTAVTVQTPCALAGFVATNENSPDATSASVMISVNFRKSQFLPLVAAMAHIICQVSRILTMPSRNGATNTMNTFSFTRKMDESNVYV